ncbi:MAG: hypothetical protein Q3961_04230 [Bifidobacteriaceae bacterium]|nr:hypothetical protein [Bifidobacteriaceae bacterium]
MDGDKDTGDLGSSNFTSEVEWVYNDPIRDGSIKASTVTDDMKSRHPGMQFTQSAIDGIGDTLTRANDKCKARTGGKSCRVVGYGYVLSTAVSDGSLSYGGGSGNHSAQEWGAAWAKATNNKTFYYKGAAYNTSIIVNGNTTIDRFAASLMNTSDITQTSFIALVFADGEPQVNYTLTVNTQAAATQNLRAGDNTPVYDTITTSRGNSTISENVTGNISLHFDGNPYESAKTVTKTFTQNNNTTQNSPQFTPQDFGWDRWTYGTYWYDITVNKQGRMKDPVDTPDREPSETFTLQAIPPTNPKKQVVNKVSAHKMTNTTRLSLNTGRGG